MAKLPRVLVVMGNVEIEEKINELDKHGAIQETRYFKLDESDYLWLIEQAEKVETLQNKLNHFMKDAETKQEIIYKLQRKLDKR